MEVLQIKYAKIREGNSISDKVVGLGRVRKVIDIKVSDKPIIVSGDGVVFKSWAAAAKQLALDAGYTKQQIRQWGAYCQ